MSPSPVHSASFLALDNANVVLSTWKRAEDGHGSILRLTEIAGSPETLRLSTPHLQMERAWQCSLLEECMQELPVRDGSVVTKLKPFEILTLRLETQPEKMP
jgi:alpha-mannosidase